MKPVVIIATDNRIQISKRNIESLLIQPVKPMICLIVSNEAEYWWYKGLFNDGVGVHNEMNNPLGNKWQSGVKRYSDANPLIITGSDDILGEGFIENACRLVEQGNHFIGLRQWYQHKDGKAYKCQYMAKNNMPLGGGRVYSGEMLKRINYQVFDPKKDKHLDDLGWDNAKKSGLKCLILEEPEKEGLSIHAIKGDWKKMNEFTLNHQNIRLLASYKSEKVLPNFFK